MKKKLGRPKGSKNKVRGVTRMPTIAGVRPTRGGARFAGATPEEKHQLASAIARQGAAARWGKAPKDYDKPIEQKFQEARTEAKAAGEPPLTIPDFHKLVKVQVDEERRLALRLQNETQLRMLIPASEFESALTGVIDTIDRAMRELPSYIEADDIVDETQAAHDRARILAALRGLRERLAQGSSYAFSDSGAAPPGDDASDTGDADTAARA